MTLLVSMSKLAKATGVGILIWLLLRGDDANGLDFTPMPNLIPDGGLDGNLPVNQSGLNESFLGTNNPRGIRNNNPGNLKISGSAWQGKIPVSQNTDGTFEQFQSFAYGTRALIKLLKNYIAGGHNTIEKIIIRYDLGNPNYITFVSTKTGIPPTQTVTDTKSTLKAICKAIVQFENGQDFLTDARFEAGYSLL